MYERYTTAPTADNRLEKEMRVYALLEQLLFFSRFTILIADKNMEEFVMYERYTTAPTADNRLEKEMRVYALLEQLDIPFERVDHEEAMTMEACEAIDQALGITMCKNLFLCNRQKTDFYLLLMPGEKKFLTKDFSKQLGVSRLSFADGEFMEQYLDITPGSTENRFLSSAHAGRKEISDQRFFQTVRRFPPFFCRWGIHGTVSGYHTGLCQYPWIDE